MDHKDDGFGFEPLFPICAGGPIIAGSEIGKGGFTGNRFLPPEDQVISSWQIVGGMGIGKGSLLPENEIFSGGAWIVGRHKRSNAITD